PPAQRTASAPSSRSPAARNATIASTPGWSGSSSHARITALMRLLPDVVVAEGSRSSDETVTVRDGRITDVAPSSPADVTATDITRLPGKALLPGTVNAHCHAFQSLLRGLGDDLAFMAWRDRELYPYSARLDRDGIYLGAAFAFAEMLLHGVTTCVDFFYL